MLDQSVTQQFFIFARRLTWELSSLNLKPWINLSSLQFVSEIGGAKKYFKGKLIGAHFDK
jgi:hypothetical protein